jgi:hypothetical protein
MSGYRQLIRSAWAATAVAAPLLAASGPVTAQTPPATPAAAPAAAAPSAHALDLAAQLVVASGGDPRQAVVSDATFTEGWAAIQRSIDGARPEWRAMSDQAVREEMKVYADRLYQGEVEMYARQFTEAQLTDILAFYRSASGQAFVKQAKELTAERTQLTRRLGGDLVGRIVANFCGKAPCPPPTPPAASAPATPPPAH